MVKKLTVGYGDFVLLKDISFNVNKGDVFIISGRLGVRQKFVVARVDRVGAAAAGKFFIDGVDFSKAAPPVRDEIMQRCGILYQSGALFSSMTLAENVALPLQQYTDLFRARGR